MTGTAVGTWRVGGGTAGLSAQGTPSPEASGNLESPRRPARGLVFASQCVLLFSFTWFCSSGEPRPSHRAVFLRDFSFRASPSLGCPFSPGQRLFASFLLTVACSWKSTHFHFSATATLFQVPPLGPPGPPCFLSTWRGTARAACRSGLDDSAHCSGAWTHPSGRHGVQRPWEPLSGAAGVGLLRHLLQDWDPERGPLLSRSSSRDRESHWSGRRGPRGGPEKRTERSPNWGHGRACWASGGSSPG